MRPAGIKSVGECSEYFSAIELAPQPKASQYRGTLPLARRDRHLHIQTRSISVVSRHSPTQQAREVVSYHWTPVAEMLLEKLGL
jgi:hypothetical protein